MPVCSYVVFPKPGQTRHLATQLAGMPGCSAEVPQEGEVLVLVTDTVTDAQEKALQADLQEMNDIQCMVMTFGAPDEMES
ncbi:MAG: hypothetical protein HN712_23025 [Gemmatimonadetes bacterium]|mgnify:CR=1 FL=1|jgi:nitrate reductase NapAB chaperone NapD|nr:hypothetical protein [Gemmatimonadota bacterium]MBT6145928.1 hypothetical protein [Gemmatimonadota bacterium]MBT7863207.1 hypothetical protein [Gemmatimonadota bacterium]